MPYLVVRLCCFDCMHFEGMFIYYYSLEHLKEHLMIGDYNYIVYDSDLNEVARY